MHDHIFESRIPFLALHDFSFFFFFVGCMHAMDGRNEGCLFLLHFTLYTPHLTHRRTQACRWKINGSVLVVVYGGGKEKKQALAFIFADDVGVHEWIDSSSR